MTSKLSSVDGDGQILEEEKVVRVTNLGIATVEEAFATIGVATNNNDLLMVKVIASFAILVFLYTGNTNLALRARDFVKIAINAESASPRRRKIRRMLFFVETFVEKFHGRM